MDLIKENPKAFITALIGLGLILMRNFVPAEIIPLEAYPNLELIIGAIIIYFFGRYTRLSKSSAELLNELNKEK